MVIDWLIHVAGVASYQNVFSEPFRFGSCHSNDEMMGGRGEEYKRDMARQLSGSQRNTLELYFFKPSCQFNWLQTVFGQRPWQFVRRRGRWMELYWMSCVLFSCAGWPFDRNESASFAHFLRSVSSTLSGVRRGNNQLCPYLCILCICIFVQSNPSDPTWAALISTATSDPCWATTHWDNSP